EAKLAFADSDEMPVSFDEAGNGELAIEIDHLRRRCDVPRHVGRRSNENDLLPARRQRLCLGHGFVYRDNAAVLKHEIGGDRGGGGGGGPGGGTARAAAGG